LVDVLITGGAIVTMDPQRHVLEDWTIDRNDLRHLLDYTAGYWGHSRY